MPCFSSLLLWLPSITGVQEVSFAAAITACGRSTRWHVASGTWLRWSSNRFIPMKALEALANVKYVNLSWVMTWKSLRLKLFEEVYTASRASLTCFSAAASWLDCWYPDFMLNWYDFPLGSCLSHVRRSMWTLRCDVVPGEIRKCIRDLAHHSFKVSVHDVWQIEGLHVYTSFRNAFIARAYMSYSLIVFVSFCFFCTVLSTPEILRSVPVSWEQPGNVLWRCFLVQPQILRCELGPNAPNMSETKIASLNVFQRFCVLCYSFVIPCGPDISSLRARIGPWTGWSSMPQWAVARRVGSGKLGFH